MDTKTGEERVEEIGTMPLVGAQTESDSTFVPTAVLPLEKCSYWGGRQW